MQNELSNQKITLQRTIEMVLSEAKKLGAQAAEATIGYGVGLTVTARMGALEKIEYEHDKALNINLYIDHQKGCASTTDFSEQEIKQAVKSAFDIATYTSQDNCAGLADANLLATNALPDLDIYHPWEISPEEASEIAINCEQKAFAIDNRIKNSDGAVLSSYSGTHYYGNTHNFIGGWDWSVHTIECTMIAESTTGMQRDGWYSKTCNKDDLEDINTIAEKAANRTVQRLDARKIHSQKAAVIYEASVAKELFSALISAISGASLYRQASFLLNQKGEAIFSEQTRISEQPHLKKALGSAAFDNDGVATKEHDIVHSGILQDYVLGSYSARKLGLETTGNAGGVHNLVVHPQSYGLTDLLKMMGTGLFITDVIGFGTNQVTGDYSRGVAGFWVENGALTYPVEEITVAGNLKNMYRNIVAVANDIDRRGNILTGSVLIDSMTISGS